MKLFKHAKSLLVVAFALALVCVAFAFTTKASAATIATGVTANYDPVSDAIEFTAETDQTLTIYVLKDAKTAMTGKEKAKKTVVVSGGAATLVLNDKSGLKVAENKPLYLYVAVSGAAITADANITANFKLAATDVKKVDSVTLNYGKAVAENEDTVLAVKATSTAEGATSALVTDLSTVAVTDIKVDQNKKKVVFYEAVGTEYLGNSLYDAITDGYSTAKGEKYYKHTLNVKILGTDKQVTVDDVTYDGRRSSKAKSVSLKNPAKAVKVKVDYLKGTIALKSGLDFVVLTEATTPSAIEAELWQTILPVSDKGTGTQFVQSTEYNYVKKLTDESTATEKLSFYNGEKIKSLTLASICEAKWPDAVSNTAIIYVRKTATDKAPASKENETGIKVTKPLAAPVIATTGGAITATYDAKKKAFTLASANISGANTNGGYEYLVVTKAQYDSKNIDFGSSKWSKLVPGKALKTALSSTVVYKTGDTKKEKISTVDSDKNIVNDKIYILIRGAGVKENAKSHIDGALPTEIAVTKFHVEGTGETAKVQWLIVDP